ncbi:ribokinase [Dysosmobacter sp.]|uniref:ribokinase n=1 Tax=Dysosmobacter sp. TaxID=2591382 RepID=UPI002A864B6E|nr:ribokinase [Dysosmobacter sp.]MDY3282211.1 ribokinase [Dysosmobacter sp.]
MLKKPNILVVGSLMTDLIASTKRAPNSGETVIGLKFTTAPGGKGANQAVQCARLGAHVTMVGQVGGDDFGRAMVANVAAAGVNTDHITVDADEASGVAQILLEVTDHGAQNRITVCPGANFTLTAEDLAWLKEEIGNYDLLMMQFELPMEVVETVAEWAYDAGVPVMVNPAPAAPISDRLLRCVTFLSPNEHEAAAIAGHPIRVDETGASMEDIEAVAAVFREKGVRNLMITLGENGSVVAGPEGISRTDCVRMPHVADPTAAGDSFVAAFCTGLCAGLPQREALAFASHAAAITVSRMGAQPSLPTVTEVQELLRRRNYTGFDPAVLDALK